MEIIKKAFYKSVPVMAGYMILGIGFGILMDNAGYGVLWSFAMALFIGFSGFKRALFSSSHLFFLQFL